MSTTQLQDVPFAHEKVKDLRVPIHMDGWKALIDSAKFQFKSNVENLLQHAVDCFYASRGKVFRRNQARRANAMYHGVSVPHSRNDSDLLAAIAKFLRFALDWLKQPETAAVTG
jgi:hypothetical protein